MTDKQFNYILRRLRRDIMESMKDRTFKVKDSTIDDLMVVSVDDLYQTLRLYFDELLEEE